MPFQQSGSGGSGIGSSLLIYRFTVTGSDKSSIDTGVDATQAGSNDWTNGDLLEIYLYARTDEAVANSQVNFTFNNDAGATQYDVGRILNVNTTLSGAAAVARANWFAVVAGASCTANVFGLVRMAVPSYAGTVGFKAGELTAYIPDTAAANEYQQVFGCNYRSTSALTRLAVVCNTGAQKLKVGSSLLIYKRPSV